ncbi:MAG TPA: CHAT domain-containing protein [Crinalium sp.]|jgi:CHAT domain-containing protein
MATPNPRVTVWRRVWLSLLGRTHSSFKLLKRQSSRVLVLFLATLFCAIATPTIATTSAIPSPTVSQAQTPVDLVQQGKADYEAGQYAEAARSLQQASQSYREQGDAVGEAIAQSNLSLVYQQLGQWDEAAQAIQTSLNLLQTHHEQGDRSILAQALDIQGRLQLNRGQAEDALTTWETATNLYDDLGESQNALRSRINQTEAMQALGLYRRAIDTLTQLTQTIQGQPDSLVQASALRSLGDALRVSGDLEQSRTVLQKSLEMAQHLGATEAIAAAQFLLGNTAHDQGDNPAALAFYQQVSTSGSPSIQTQAQLNRLRIFTETGQLAAAQALWPQITAQLDRLPPSRTAIYARINFAQSLIRWNRPTPHTPHSIPHTSLITQQLSIAIQQAQALGDQRAKSFALGNLGELYEQSQQWSEAEQLTQQAMNLAQQVNASDMTYLWSWQLGRIFKGQGEREKAIASYTDAVTTLQSLRKDLVAVNADVQYSFRESVEPIHRELVSLLLDTSNGAEPTQETLEQARKTIESLQLAELDNFFREACLNARPVQIDQVDRRAAVIYPIILPDRLEVILSLPQAASDQGSQTVLRHYATPNLTPADVRTTVEMLFQFLTSRASNRRVLPVAQQMYDWLIRPAEAELASSGVKTLVFVLDGVLRNVPMSVLHNGQEYLLERYSIALTPSLQLLESQPIQQQQLSVLMAGLTEGRQGFTALPNVTTEFQKIQREIPSQVLLNQQFTNTAIQSAINSVPYPVVHLATHGEFSSRLEDTFILTWDGRITINQLNSLLQATDITRRRPIELLVLSACQTAEGDDRAALGLAGVAVRAGARSTLATLWSVSDEATPILMERFYQALSSGKVTKAEALQQAQLSLLRDPQYARPFFWSPFVLVGNWL